MSSGTTVQGEDWFGGDSACVSVQVGQDDQTFEVRFQAGVATLSSGTPAVLRTWRDFSILHDTLRSGSLSDILPDLPARPTALLTSSDVASTARQQRTAAELQEYLAKLASLDQSSRAPAFLQFLQNDASEETALGVARQWTPTIVRRISREAAVSAAAPCTSVTLSWTDERGEHSAQLPVLQPNGGLGAPVIDVRSLYAKTGMFTHDPGFTSTSSCDSAITYVDGAAGVLLHRGYPIEQLTGACSFPEVAFLLVEGELPTPSQLSSFENELRAHSLIHQKLLAFYGGFKSDAHPMAIVVSVEAALSAFYPDSCDGHDAEHRRLAAVRMIAKMPTIAAIAYKTAIGEPVVYPNHSLSFASNFLHMMFAKPTAPYAVNPVHAAALETILILHADHEQNASTSTVRIASSSQANPFACIAAGIASLWGPAHGGANEAVLRMLSEIGSPERIPEFIARAKDKNDPFRLMGFGHRVYKNYDPRAKLMQKVCADVLASVDMSGHPDLLLARELERIALSDEYFVKRKLYPNVDFYSGIVLRALGIPVDMFTVLFAVSRTAGWVAQWNESFSDPAQRISRPRQLYLGERRRQFVSLADRALAAGESVASGRASNGAAVAAIMPAVAGAAVSVASKAR